MPSFSRLLTEIRALIPDSYREAAYRGLSGVVTFLVAFGVFNSDQAALWTQLGVSTVTLLFALLYSTSTWRSVLYAVVGPLGAVLMAYGIVDDVRWALITTAVAQVFGITTAAAKVVQAPVVDDTPKAKYEAA